MSSENKNYRNSIQDKRLSKIEKHIEIINGELGDIKIELAKIKTKIGWQMWIISAFAAVIGFLASKLF